MGMALFVLSLSMLFGASVVGYLVLRFRMESWASPGLSGFPPGLWLSTGILLASGGTMQWALSGIRKGREKALGPAMLLTTLLAFAFLAVQGFNWVNLVQASVTAQSSLYAFGFFMFTGLHALHVIGGLIPLAFTTFRARKGRYTRQRHAGVLHCAIYWHFLGIVWLVVVGVLYFTF
jgi:heme/copper-type cytochrome/quinol oxidase subunit 3